MKVVYAVGAIQRLKRERIYGFAEKMNITIIQIINETFEKLKCRLDENEFRIIFNYHAKLLQILNERSMMILTEEFFTKRSRVLSIKNSI